MGKFESIAFAHDGKVAIQNNSWGSSTYTIDILNRYIKYSHKVTFILRKELNGKYLEYSSIPQNFNFETFEDFKSVGGYKNLKHIYNKVLVLISDADLVICRLPSDLGIITYLAAKKLNKKILVEVVGCPLDSYRTHSKLGYLIAPVYYLIQKMIVSNSANVMFVTSSFLQSRYKNKKNSISCSDVVLPLEPEFKNRYIEKTMNKIKLGTIGNIEMKYKGYETVFQAIKILNERGYDIEYQIVGPGSQTYLKSLIKMYSLDTQIVILGSKNKNELYRWLDEDINLYIQPSYTEGLPRALIEAMSTGVICIGSNVGGIPELLPEAQIFPSKNPAGIVDCIERIGKLNLKELSLNTFNRSTVFNTNLLEEKRDNYMESLAGLD